MKPTYAALLLERDDLLEKVKTLETALRLANTPNLHEIWSNVQDNGRHYVSGQRLRAWGVGIDALCAQLGDGYTYEQKQGDGRRYDAYYIKRVA